MKRYINKFVALLIIIITTACESMLNVEPRVQIAAETALADRIGAQATLNAVYAGLRGGTGGGYYGRTMGIVPELLADNVRLVGPSTRSGRGLNEFNNLSGAHVNIWQNVGTGLNQQPNVYNTINLANLVIEAVDRIPDATDAQKAQLRARALFARSLIYFALGRI